PAYGTAETLAVRQYGRRELSAARTVLQGIELDRDLITRLDRVGTPAERGIGADRLHLERPLDLLSCVRNHQVNPDMRVGPFEFANRSAHSHQFLAVEHGEGMMCEGGRRDEKREACKSECFQFHSQSPLMASP